MRDHTQIVGNQYHREAELSAPLHHHVEDLNLNRSVKSECRVVSQEDLRLRDQRHRDDYPLGHTAGELVRI